MFILEVFCVREKTQFYFIFKSGGTLSAQRISKACYLCGSFCI